MLKSGRLLVAFLFILFSFLALTPYADSNDRIIFKKDFTIGEWHLHVSQNTFSANEPGEGILRISKTTPQDEIERGFIVFNGRFTFLRDFLVGDKPVFEKEVALKSSNRLFVFLLGHPEASVSIKIKQSDDITPAPKITAFTAEPSTKKKDGTSTLSWQTENTEFGEINPGEIRVAPIGTLQVSPATDTTYTLTAYGVGMPATAEVKIFIENSPPVADSQAIATDEDKPVAITLTGTDIDGDTLSFEVILPPNHGDLAGTPSNLTYTAIENYNGPDVFSFTANDGKADSEAATIAITVNPVNDAPVANSQTVDLNEDESKPVTLGASDVEGTLLTYEIIDGPSVGVLTGNMPNLSYSPTENYNGSDSFSFKANDGQLYSSLATVSLTIHPINDPPLAKAGPDQNVFAADTVLLDGGASSDVDDDNLNFYWSFADVPAGSLAVFFNPTVVNPAFTPDIVGTYKVQLIVNDGIVNSAPDEVTINAEPRRTTVPDVVGKTQSVAEAAIRSAILVVGDITTENSETVPKDFVISQNPIGGSSVIQNTAVDLTISLGPEIQPPAMSFSASPYSISQGGSAYLTWSIVRAESAHIDNGIGSVSPKNGSTTIFPEHTTTYTLTATGPGGSANARVTVEVTGNPEPQPEGSYGETYEDLIPSDSTAEMYDPKRFALITGEVQNFAGSPLIDVSITIHGYPEYGTVVTDSEGRFTIPVEGGGMLTVVYQKDGLIPSQRKVYVPWNDNAIAEMVVMITEDPVSTTLTFDGNADTVVTHKSQDVVDESGTRAVTMVFSGDNTAYLVDEQGNDVQELKTIAARATEYQIPEAMPAKLPPTSAFTYCAEFRVDGAERVRFEKPVIIWVDNFLDFPVGVGVPLGYYDRDRAVWIPLENGVVVQLLDTEPADSPDGRVDALDADGDGLPDDIDGNGSFSNDVQGLDDTQRYAAGSTFWRAAVAHFSPIDLNFPFGAPSGAVAPNSAAVAQADTKKNDGNDPKRHICSFVEEKSRVFHEDIPISGTNIMLHYASNRVTGFKPGVIYVPASGDTVPESLVKIIVRVDVAGRKYDLELPPAPNQSAEIEWDGLDNLGRPVTGSVVANVQIGFVYNGVYYVPADVARAFGQTGTSSLIIPTRGPVILWQAHNLKIYTERGKGTIAEGWTISSQHHVNIVDPSVLYKGDGSTYQLDTNIITTVAGNGNFGGSGDGGPATEATFSGISDIAVDKMGNLYIADCQNDRVRKVDTNGIITNAAGNGYGRPFAYVNRIAVDDSGNLYVAAGWFQLGESVYKVAVGGDISIVAGGRPPIGAKLVGISGLAVDNSGNLYISTVGDVNNVNQHRILKVDTDGIITTLAGTGVSGYSGDGDLAINAKFKYPRRIAVDSEGSVYIADSFNHRIRRVDTSGIITTVAGTGVSGFSGDGGPAILAPLDKTYGIALDALGNLNIGFWARVRNISTAKLLVPKMGDNDLGFPEKFGIGHIMDASGRHKKTVDLNTGATLNEFSYDVDKNLVSITDQFGNQITIQRDAGGVPTAIISPYGIRTELTIDGNNHLSRITYQDGNYYDFEYTADGLLTLKTQPSGNQFGHVFDSNGRITDFTDDEDGHWQFERTIQENGDILQETLTGEGNVTTYLDRNFSTGTFESTITDPSGTATLFTRSDDGLLENINLPCGVLRQLKYNTDPEYRFKYIEELTDGMPSSLQRTTQRNRTYADNDADGIPDIITDTITVNGKSNIIEQDIFQAVLDHTSPEGRVVSQLYDPVTLAIANISISGLHDTAFGYDTKGRITSITTNTRQTTFSYVDDVNGHQVTITDPQLHRWIYTYDVMDRLKSINRPDGGVVQFAYDNNGNMTVLINPVDVDHKFGFNRVNRKSSYTTPLSGSYSYIYDKDRRLIQTNLPSGKQIINIYDNNRLSQIQTLEGNIDFTYLCGNRIESITKGAESITYGYDGKLVTSETLNGTMNQALTYSYSNDFDVSSSKYADQTENYSYDNDGLLTGAGNFTITRNTGNGLPEAVSGGTLNLGRTFNGYGEVAGQGYSINSKNIINWALIRDNNGRIVSKSETVGVDEPANFEYIYDSMGRLLTVKKDGDIIENYSYDLSGTRTSETNALKGLSGKAYSYSDEDHLLTAGNMQYEYNDDGFLTSKTDETNETDKTSYVYSSRGELLKVTLPDLTEVEYLYDPIGRRIAKKIGESIVEKYIWQGMTRLLAVYDGDDNLLMRFEYVDDRMPVVVTTEGVTYYLVYDQVGSLRVVADSAGDVVKRIDYDSFGNIITDTNEAFKIPFGFAGGLHDRDTALVRFGYRDYDPDVGRWTAKDPIGFAGRDTDLYGYVLNDPVNFYDPYGLIKWGAVGKGVLAAFGGGVAIAGGALASSTGVGAIGGVPAVLIGSAGLGWGISQTVAGFLDNEIPFMGTKEAIIKGTTETGLLQDELLGVNTLGDMLLTGRTAPTDIGKINDAIQSGYSIYSSSSKIVESLSNGNSGSSPCQ